MLKINIGCGEFPAAGWVNIDAHSAPGGPQPDVTASADSLPFGDRTVGRAYAGHVLEHIPFEDVPAVLDEIKRVMALDGLALFVGPDLDRALASFPEEVDSIRHGAGRWPGDRHLWESRESTMMELILEGGWIAAAVPIADVSEDWPVTSRIGWQFAILAKPHPSTDGQENF